MNLRRNIIKKTSIILCTVVLCLQSIQGVQAVVETRIQVFENQVGSYFDVDIHSRTMVNTEWKIMEKVDLLEVDEPSQEEIEIEENLDDFEFVEAINKYATLYQSIGDTGLQRLVLSQYPVNYVTDNGGYAPINTQLTPAVIDPFLRAIEDPIYQNEANTLKSFFGADIKSDGIEIHHENTQLSLKPQIEPLALGVVNGNEIRYELDNHQSLSYSVHAGAIIEEFSSLSTVEEMSLSYEVGIENGSVHLNNQLITIYNASNLPVFSMAHPLVTDSSGKEERVSVSYENGLLLYQVSDQFLQDATYPIVMKNVVTTEINAIWTMTHLGHDISVAQNFATSVISNISQEDLAYMGWQLPEQHQYHGYLYLGNNPAKVSGTALGNSYSFYKLHDGALDTYQLRDKYIKRAILKTPIKEQSGDNIVYGCTILESFDFNSANYNKTYDLISGEKVQCTSSNSVKSTDWQAEINITDYLKGVSEQGKGNNGVMMMLKDGDKNHLTLHAHEYYYIDSGSGAYPSVWIEYYDEPEITQEIGVEDFTFHVRPFTRYNYENAHAIFTVFGVDGLSPLTSTVNLKIKDDENNVVAEESMEVKENFRIYPDYIEITDAQVYEIEESNYQFNKLFGNIDENTNLFEMNKVYTIEVTSTLGSESTTGSTWFQIYEVNNFDVLSSVASFYGVSTEVLIADNNLQDELIVAENVLFIREPTRNQGEEYVTPNLSDDIKKQIDASLQGRGIECEYDFEPINLNTGNFVLEAKDGSLVVYGETVAFGRVYNSTNHDYLGAFGYGWSYSADYRVVPNQDNTTVILIMPDGRQYVFEKDTDGVYRNWLHQAITLTYENGVYQYHDQKTTIHFNKNGLIESLVDGNERVTKYFHNQGLISAIEYPDGKKVIFNYNQDNVIENVTLPGNVKVFYEYDQDLNLIGFIDQSENKVIYSYDNDHQMISWVNRNGNLVVKNTYTDGQVTFQEDGLGNQYQLIYQEDRTVTVDNEGNERTIVFDDVKTTKEVLVGDESIEKKEFDQGLFVKHELEDGTVIVNTYEDGNLIKTTSSLGTFLEYTYDDRNNLIEWKNEQGQKALFAYDEKSQLIQTTDILGNVEKIEYNQDGQKTKVIDAVGIETLFIYNDQGEKIKEVKSTGSSEVYTYNDAGFLTSNTDQRGNTISYTHSNRNEIIQIVYPDQTEERFQYDASGNQIAYQDRTGAIDYREYDIYGNLTKLTDSLGSVTLYEYDGNQQLIKTVYPSGKEERTEFDERGRVIKKITDGRITSTLTYSVHGVKIETDEFGQKTENEYDEFGNVVKVTSPTGVVTRSVYNENQQLVKTIDGFGNETVFEYDHAGQLVKESSEFKTVIKDYNAVGNFNKRTTVVGDTELVVSYEYNEFGQVMKEIDPLGNVIEYVYDQDKIKSIINQEGDKISYTYDENGEVAREVYDDGSYISFEYDGNRNKVKEIDANGNVIEYQYNAKNQMIGKKLHFDDGRTAITTWEYDILGNLTKEISPHGMVSEYTYNQYGKMTSKKVNGTEVMRFTFNEYQQLIEEVINGVSTQYEYNQYNQRIKDIHQSGLIKEYTYNIYGQLIEVKENGVVSEAVVFDERGRIIKNVDNLGNEKITSYNDNGLVEKVVEYSGESTVYTYDDMGRISREVDNYGNEKSYGYDRIGRVVVEINNGVVERREYDSKANISKVTNGLGFITEYTYDNGKNLKSIKDALGNVTEYDYDALGNCVETRVNGVVVQQQVFDLEGRLIKAVDGEGGVQQTQYNQAGFVSLRVDQLGNPTTYTYDKKNNLISVKDARGNLTRYGYNELNQRVMIEDARGNQTKQEFDIFGNITKVTYPNGSVSVSHYNDKNQLIQTISTSGVITDYQYNSLGQLLQLIEKGQPVEVNTYSETGRLVESKNADGIVTKTEFDSEGRVIKESNNLGQEYITAYDKLGNVIKEISPTGVVTEYTFDAINQSVETRVNGKRNATMEYDDRGNLISIIDVLGNKTEMNYDLNNQLVSTVDSLGNEETWEMDAVGNIIKGTDAQGAVTETIFDENYNVIQQISPLGNRKSYEYDKNNNLTGVQSERGQWMYYEYDSMSNKVKETVGSQEIKYEYTLSNQLSQVTYPDGSTESFEYNPKGSMTAHTRQDGTTLNYVFNDQEKLIREGDIIHRYDEFGRLIESVNAWGSVKMTYDKMSQITQVNQNGDIVSYEYDQFGNQTKVIYPDQREMTKEYNDQNLLVKVTSGEDEVQYTYDSLSRVTQERYSNNLVTSIDYDEVGRVIRRETKTQTRASNLLYHSSSYEYNLEGSVIKETQTNLDKTIVKEYQYNQSDELIETKTIDDGKETTITYLTAVNGNKVEVNQEANQKEVKEYNDLNQLIKSSANGLTTTYRYDGNGNRIEEKRSDGAIKKYTYNQYNQLVETVDFDGVKTLTIYDGLGYRVDMSSSQLYTWSEDKNISIVNVMRTFKTRIEYLDGKNYCEAYFLGTDLIEKTVVPQYTRTREDKVEVETTYHTTKTNISYINDYTVDHPVVLTENQDGNITNFMYGTSRIQSDDRIYIYDAYGSVVQDLSHEGGLLESYSYSDYGRRNVQYNPFVRNSSYGYRSEAHTRDHLQYLRARFYDTTSEVFIQQDEYKGEETDLLSKNRYLYVLNNPYKYSDPSGNVTYSQDGGGSALGWKGGIYYYNTGATTNYLAAIAAWDTDGNVKMLLSTREIINLFPNASYAGHAVKLMNDAKRTRGPRLFSNQYSPWELYTGKREAWRSDWRRSEARFIEDQRIKQHQISTGWNNTIQDSLNNKVENSNHDPTEIEKYYEVPTIYPNSPKVDTTDFSNLAKGLVTATASHLNITDMMMLQILNETQESFEGTSLEDRVIDACLFYLGIVSMKGLEGLVSSSPRAGGIARAESFLFNTHAVFNPTILIEVIKSFNVETSYLPQYYEKEDVVDTYCNLYVQDLIHAYGGGKVPFPNQNIGANNTSRWLHGEPVFADAQKKIPLDAKSRFAGLDMSNVIVTGDGLIKAKSNQWVEVDRATAQNYADQGRIVVLNHRTIGHISLARPSEKGEFRHTQAGGSNTVNNTPNNVGWNGYRDVLKYHVWMG